MPQLKETNVEPIPGYRLIAPLGNGGFGEVWKCEAPGGLFKAIKFVYGDLNGLDADSARAEEELRAVQRIKSIRHPFLLSMDRVENIDGELVIVMELADQNLHELMAGYRKAGQPGIPRAELLGYLREAAEVLDLIHQQHHLQHLDIKPRNLFLVSKHVKVADFGLVNSLSAATGSKAGHIKLGAITPLYAAPELFHGTFSRHSDQYSLAIVYQELLTGSLPFEGKNCRQLLFLHNKAEPDLKRLPPRDRAVVARALAKSPEKRFPSCMDFVQALVAKPTAAVAAGNAKAASGARAKAVAGAPGKGAPKVRPSSSADTVSNQSPDTVRAKPVPDDLLPGHRFLECLSRSPLVDQWRIETDDGRERLAKILYGFVSGDRLSQALVRLKSLHHPGLARMEALHDSSRLVLLSDPVKGTLRDRAVKCQARRLPGIARGELLNYLGHAAEVLDYLYQQHSIVHLGLNPRNLGLVDDGRVQIAEFGLAQLLWLPAGQAVAQRNNRYAPPELFHQRANRNSDQYSLALIYQEMLTGVHALPALAKVSGSDRGRVKPDLSRLPELDRPVIARALDPEPRKRWPSCTAMVSALQGVAVDQPAAKPPKDDRFATLLAASRQAPRSHPATPQANLHQLINDLIAGLGGHVPPAGDREGPTLSAAGDELVHKFQAGLPLGSARVKLEAFCQQWYGQMVCDDEKGCIIHVSMPSNFWKQWIGRQSGLEIRADLARVQALAATPIEASVRIRPFRCSQKRGAQLVEEMGPALLDSLRGHLLVNPEKRTRDRLLWPHPVKVCPIYPDGSKGEAIDCPGKDISASGIGFYLPDSLDTAEVLIHLSSRGQPTMAVTATLVRAKRCADGWYDVGALFHLPTVRKSVPELCLR